MKYIFTAKGRRARRGFLKLSASLGVSALASAFAKPVQASSPQFTITVGGAFLRQQPLLTSPLMQPVFTGERYDVMARTPDNAWLQLHAAETGKQGWLLALYGQADGDIQSTPATGAPPAPVKAQTVALPKWITPITSKAKKLYRAKGASKDLNAFTVIGDCNSVPEAYLGRVPMGLFDASKHPGFGSVIERFASSFMRTSVGAFSGFNSGSMWNPEWANPQHCMAGEGPLACELRRSRASVMFVSLGTGDTFTWKDFEKNYRGIVEHLLNAKVLPVLVTKADDLESQQGEAAPGFINDVVRRLGQEYAVPVIDFWAATRGLKDYGMRWEGNENFHMTAEGSDLRILLTLHTLAAITSK